jgi:hypothetical protein
MRNGLSVAVLATMFALPLTTAVTPMSAYAATNKARSTALADCERQAAAKRLAKNQTIQRRNFLKSCMIDRGFQGGIN